MPKVLTDPAYYTAIADAIRYKNGDTTALYTPAQMAPAVAALSTGQDSGPSNVVIYDSAAASADLSGVYVRLPPLTFADLVTGGGSTMHPAFLVGGESTLKTIYIGKFNASQSNNLLYSRYGEDPAVSITLDECETRCKNKGTGHHCVTAAEWGFLACWCKKNNCQPYGNNNYGKDSRESAYVATPTSTDGGRTARVATGTGPVTWSHNGQIDGIWDLNGNVWEWVSGIRLVYGELQLIPYNNAAMPDTDTSASSDAWKAVNVGATGYGDLYIPPDGSGTTSDSVKLDFVSSHWQWGDSITSRVNSNRSAAFASTTARSGLSAFVKMFLRAMALLPEEGDTGYEDDAFYANNGAGDRCVFRAGAMALGAPGGIFTLNFNYPRTQSINSLGGRSAFYA